MYGNRGRSYHVIDLENLLGTAREADDVRTVWDAYRAGIGIGPDDQVLIASGPTLAKVALFALAGEHVRYYVRSGIDGADHELLFRTDERHAAVRYDTMLIASGDNAFTPLAHRASQAGLVVWQVAGRGGVSRSLRETAHLHARLRLPAMTRHLALAA